MMRRSKDDGIIIVTVLWIIAILSLMASGLAYRASVEARLTGYRLRGFDAEHSVESEAMLTIFTLRNLIPQTCTTARNLQELGTGQAEKDLPYRVRVTDAESRINLNRAPKEVLMRLFDHDEAIVDSLQDWMDSDSLERPRGAEESYYDTSRNSYPCKNGPLQCLEEFRYVSGVDRELYDKIEPLITVYGRRAVNINTAGRDVLFALGFDEVLVDKIVRYRLGEDGDPDTGDEETFQDPATILEVLSEYEYLDQVETAAINKAVSGKLLDVKSRYFRVEAWSSLKGAGRIKKVVAVVTFDEDNNTQFLQWRLLTADEEETAADERP